VPFRHLHGGEISLWGSHYHSMDWEAGRMARSGQRPLSPHLSIWKWGPHMLISILHRATGDGLAVLGGIGFVWWLYALSSGPDAYALFLSVATSWFGYVVMVGLSWAFFQHMFSGLRHLLLDIGAGYALDVNRRGSIIIMVLGVLATAAFWAWIMLGRGV
jgi:succinate dehydrogenase / fumarate reductase, cytochrome b subunit